jgi:hypothetical protein
VLLINDEQRSRCRRDWRPGDAPIDRRAANCSSAFCGSAVTAALQDASWQRAPRGCGGRSPRLLDRLGEDLEDIFIGRRPERVLETRWCRIDPSALVSCRANGLRPDRA